MVATTYVLAIFYISISLILKKIIFFFLFLFLFWFFCVFCRSLSLSANGEKCVRSILLGLVQETSTLQTNGLFTGTPDADQPNTKWKSLSNLLLHIEHFVVLSYFPPPQTKASAFNNVNFNTNKLPSWNSPYSTNEKEQEEYVSLFLTSMCRPVGTSHALHSDTTVGLHVMHQGTYKSDAVSKCSFNYR